MSLTEVKGHFTGKHLTKISRNKVHPTIMVLFLHGKSCKNKCNIYHFKMRCVNQVL